MIIIKGVDRNTWIKSNFKHCEEENVIFIKSSTQNFTPEMKWVMDKCKSEGVFQDKRIEKYYYYS